MPAKHLIDKTMIENLQNILDVAETTEPEPDGSTYVSCLDLRDAVVTAVYYVCIKCHEQIDLNDTKSWDCSMFNQGTAEFEAQLVNLLAYYERDECSVLEFVDKAKEVATTLIGYLND